MVRSITIAGMKASVFNSSFYFALVFCLVALPALSSCSQEEPKSDIQAQATDIIGEWAVDEEAMKESLGWNPLQRLGLELYKDMTIEITRDTLTVQLQMMGESKEFSGKYKVVGTEGNLVKVEALSGNEKGVVSEIAFLEKDKIRFTKKTEKDDPPLIMVRK